MRDLGPSEHGETRTACDFDLVKGEEEEEEGRGNKNNTSATTFSRLHEGHITETMLHAGCGNKESV